MVAHARNKNVCLKAGDQRIFATCENLILIVSGHKDGRVSRMHLKEHVISQLLYDAGVSRKSFRLRLSIKSPQYYHKCMTNPSAHLSINQLTMVADVLDMKLLEVIGIVMGQKPTNATKWYDKEQPLALQVAEPPAPYGTK